MDTNVDGFENELWVGETGLGAKSRASPELA